jgi:hypothetical protein
VQRVGFGVCFASKPDSKIGIDKTTKDTDVKGRRAGGWATGKGA